MRCSRAFARRIDSITRKKTKALPFGKAFIILSYVLQRFYFPDTAVAKLDIRGLGRRAAAKRAGACLLADHDGLPFQIHLQRGLRGQPQGIPPVTPLRYTGFCQMSRENHKIFLLIFSSYVEACRVLSRDGEK